MMHSSGAASLSAEHADALPPSGEGEAAWPCAAASAATTTSSGRQLCCAACARGRAGGAAALVGGFAKRARAFQPGCS